MAKAVVHHIILFSKCVCKYKTNNRDKKGPDGPSVGRYKEIQHVNKQTPINERKFYMNNNKFNEEENNGVVRKRVMEKISDHKKSVAGIITGVMLVMMLTFLTSSNAFGPASDAVNYERNLNTFEVSYSSSVTTITTSTIKKSSTTTASSLTSTTKTTNKSTTSTVEETTVTSQPETTGVSDDVETTAVEEVETIVDEVIVESNNDTTEPTSEYIVYKPSTHYVHKNTCRWFTSDCQEITSTEGIECRKCSECNPDIEIMNAYVPPAPQGSLAYITDAERIMLCNVVAGEYGSDWVSLYDKACVVAVVMNRYYDGGWQGYGRANTISNVLTAPGQFVGYYAANGYNSLVTQSCIDAVEYYFNHQSEFPHYLSFYGDGRMNHFS